MPAMTDRCSAPPTQAFSGCGLAKQLGLDGPDPGGLGEARVACGQGIEAEVPRAAYRAAGMGFDDQHLAGLQEAAAQQVRR